MKFLVFQSNYNEVEVALYIDHVRVDFFLISKIDVAQKMIISVQESLNKNELNLSDLNFIAANIGPAPFTTLRVVLATLNGIAFVNKIPLVGVDAITSFIHEINKNNTKNILVLLNAFGGDLYFGYLDGQQIETGYNSIENLVSRFGNKEDILVSGNALEKYPEIKTRFNQANFLNIPYVSIDTVADLAQNAFESKMTSEQLVPLYLKNL